MSHCDVKGCSVCRAEAFEALSKPQFEEERLKGLIAEMSLMLGTLRGIIFSYEDKLVPNQIDSLKRIDKQINLMFYTHQFKMKE